MIVLNKKNWVVLLIIFNKKLEFALNNKKKNRTTAFVLVFSYLRKCHKVVVVCKIPITTIFDFLID